MPDSAAKPNILIFGFGAVGATYGLILHNAGCAITAVCRSNHRHVKDHGVLIRSVHFGHTSYHPRAVPTVAEAAESGPYDYIIVACKAFPGTAEQIREAVTPARTAIVLAQNGIGIEADYAALYPANPIVSGVVYLPVTQVAPGVVEHHGTLQRFEIGTYPARSTASSAREKVARLSALWSAGGADAPVLDDVQSVRWKKVAINAAWSPISALTVCDDGNFLRSSLASATAPRAAEEAVRGIMLEVGRVATAAGYPDLITPEWIEQDLDRPRERIDVGGKEPSMLVDVHHSRAMEVEAILGNTLCIARRHGVDTPGLSLLHTLATARNFSILRPAGEQGWKPISRT